MKLNLFIWVILFVLASCSSAIKESDLITSDYQIRTASSAMDTSISFKEVQEKYDTLIPIFDSFFITHYKLKWGVIDSSGKEIVKFIGDGVKSISDTMGIVSVYRTSHSLNTGMPRYQYSGEYFFFTKKGLISKKGDSFGILIEGRSDYHKDSFIIESGPYYYLPDIKNDTIQKRSFRWGIIK